MKREARVLILRAYSDAMGEPNVCAEPGKTHCGTTYAVSLTPANLLLTFFNSDLPDVLDDLASQPTFSPSTSLSATQTTVIVLGVIGSILLLATATMSFLVRRYTRRSKKHPSLAIQVELGDMELHEIISVAPRSAKSTIGSGADLLATVPTNMPAIPVKTQRRPPTKARTLDNASQRGTTKHVHRSFSQPGPSPLRSSFTECDIHRPGSKDNPGPSEVASRHADCSSEGDGRGDCLSNVGERSLDSDVVPLLARIPGARMSKSKGRNTTLLPPYPSIGGNDTGSSSSALL